MSIGSQWDSRREMFPASSGFPPTVPSEGITKPLVGHNLQIFAGRRRGSAMTFFMPSFARRPDDPGEDDRLVILALDRHWETRGVCYRAHRRPNTPRVSSRRVP